MIVPILYSIVPIGVLSADSAVPFRVLLTFFHSVPFRSVPRFINDLLHCILTLATCIYTHKLFTCANMHSTKEVFFPQLHVTHDS